MILETNKHLYPLGVPNPLAGATPQGRLYNRYGHTLKSSRGNWGYALSQSSFEYDFKEINRIVDTETFVARIFKKKKDLIVKSEPLYKTTNSKNLKYLSKRFESILYSSGLELKELLSQLAESLVTYNNAFILTVRPETDLEKNTYREIPPIESLHVISPLKLKPVINLFGDVLGFNYYRDSSILEPIFLPKDYVYHIAIDKKLDVSIGTPSMEAVKDDILSLRQIEEAMERLIYKNASPLLHAKIGTDDSPADVLSTGELEIDYYNDLISRMDDEGGLTTSHRVDIDLLGTESKALRFEGSMQYYKSRVVSGLGASLLDLGEAPASLSSAGAESISKVLRDDVESYQKAIGDFFTDKIFQDILLDAKWNANKLKIESKDKVVFELPLSNLTDKIKEESHWANLVNTKVMSREDFSRRTGYELPPLEEEIKTDNSKVFKNLSQPENQFTDDSVKVSDGINFTGESIYEDIYLYLLKYFEELGDIKPLGFIAESLVVILQRYKELDYPEETLERIFYDSLEQMIFNVLRGKH